MKKKNLLFAVILFVCIGCQPVNHNFSTSQEIEFSTKTIGLTDTDYEKTNNEVELIQTLTITEEASSIPAHTSSPFFSLTPDFTPTPSLTPTPINYELKMASDDLRKYIGTIVPPYPDNFDGNTGILIQESWVLSFMNFDEKPIIILETSLGMGKWMIVDLFILPPLLEGESLIPNGCMVNGVIDNGIIVYAIYEINERYALNEDIRLVWRINFENGSFQEISKDEIECYADNALHW